MSYGVTRKRDKSDLYQWSQTDYKNSDRKSNHFTQLVMARADDQNTWANVLTFAMCITQARKKGSESIQQIHFTLIIKRQESLIQMKFSNLKCYFFGRDEPGDHEK